MEEVVAKLATGDFLDGTFGRVWPAYDNRLAGVAVRLGVITTDDVAANENLMNSLSTEPDVREALGQFRFVPTWFANLFTIWTLAIELTISACYLLGRRDRVLIAGHAALLIFCFTTYTVVPVQGFAAVLLALAIASAGESRWSSVLTMSFACVVLLPISAHLI